MIEIDEICVWLFLFFSNISLLFKSGGSISHFDMRGHILIDLYNYNGKTDDNQNKLKPQQT